MGTGGLSTAFGTGSPVCATGIASLEAQAMPSEKTGRVSPAIPVSDPSASVAKGCYRASLTLRLTRPHLVQLLSCGNAATLSARIGAWMFRLGRELDGRGSNAIPQSTDAAADGLRVASCIKIDVGF